MNSDHRRASWPSRFGTDVFLAFVLTAFASTAAGAEDMRLSSAAFEEGQSIPKAYTCEGRDLSPPLSWDGVPAGTKSLVLIVDDPDAPDPAAPRVTWVHWLLYNLPASSGGLPEAATPGNLPRGALQGRNGWGRAGYGGPCPPIGRHRYFFKLYALDIVLPDLKQPEKAALVQAMRGHVLGESQLVGTYRKGQ